MIGRCPLCHDEPTGEVEVVACRACLAVHHGECWAELERCAACRGARALREQGGREPGRALTLLRAVLDSPFVGLMGAVTLTAIGTSATCLALPAALFAVRSVVGFLVLVGLAAVAVACFFPAVGWLSDGVRPPQGPSPVRIAPVRRVHVAPAAPAHEDRPVQDWPAPESVREPVRA